MARTPADPEKLMAHIAASRSEMEVGATLSAVPMAKALGWSWINLRETINVDPAFPIVKRGSEGVQWIFDAHAVFDYCDVSAQDEIARRADRKARVVRLTGVDVGEGGDSLSVEEIARINLIQTQVQKRRIEQREFVPRAEVERSIADLFTMLQTELLGAGAQMDPAGQWPPGVRDGVDQAHRTLLVRLHDLVEPWTLNDARPAAHARA